MLERVLFKKVKNYFKNFSNINNMANLNTAQKSPERQAEQNQSLITLFQTLKALPNPFSRSQCVSHKHELLICGGYQQRACYSYNTINNEYKFICKYPIDVKLNGHCVVKLVDSNSKDRNESTLLSFGGKYKHTLMMKYVSIWSNENNNNDNKINHSKELNKSNNYNKWTPFTNNHNRSVIIGREHDNYEGVRAVIGGSNSHLLFITYGCDISVFDLNTFQFIKHHYLPINNRILYHCFVSNSENGQGQEMIKTNKKQINKIIKCCCLNRIQDYQLNMMKKTALFKFIDCLFVMILHHYLDMHMCVLMMSSYSLVDGMVYSIQERKWITFENDLPIQLENCVAILSEDNTNIHFIGGQGDKSTVLSTHMQTRLRVWDSPQSVIIKITIQYWTRVLKIKLGWIDEFNKIILNYIK
ncbi:hypothetical protein RFI_29746 [Reticulomyxa filosa]|uniref:Uncharacterized protein n=1 Tax=Reticulomyxa filosa TaxID=46433 RepID=X6M0D1_RETFI|nr:hypothetical protein RFI_29746 [Reticulomyxa filosa]|eukprot:ETO07643.1 hypothetical protein RFI_29746 [Reticulomyxa filosa]